MAALFVVMLLAMLQALGPFLHAHLRGESGTHAAGVHLHLERGRGIAADGSAGDARARTDVAAAHTGTGLSFEGPSATTSEGDAIFMGSEYRRDRDPGACGDLPPPAPPCSHGLLRCAQPALAEPLRIAIVTPPARQARLNPPANAPPRA